VYVSNALVKVFPEPVAFLTITPRRNAKTFFGCSLFPGVQEALRAEEVV
jgi:hypothetical protein